MYVETFFKNYLGSRNLISENLCPLLYWSGILKIWYFIIIKLWIVIFHPTLFHSLKVILWIHPVYFTLIFYFYIVLQIFVGCGTVHTGRKMANCGSMLVLALTCTGMLLSGASYFLPVPIYPSEVGQSINCYCLRVNLFCFIIYRHNT